MDETARTRESVRSYVELAEARDWTGFGALLADDGQVGRITDFWPDPYDPPPGREHLVERW